MRKGSQSTELRCSFCQKPEGAIRRLIANPDDFPKAYICEECVAVCASILKDDHLLASLDEWMFLDAGLALTPS